MNKIDKYIASLPSLEGKKVVVTGANSGLGLEIIKFCLTKKASVVLACRNKNKADKVIEELKEKYPDSQIDLLLYSQDILSSCQQFVDNLFKEYSDWYALVLNAGIFKAKKGELNKEGFPVVSGTNSFGLAYIIREVNKRILNDKVERKVIIQSSIAAYLTKFKNVQECLQNPNRYYFKQYNWSKNVCLNLGYHYAKENINPNIKYLIAEPGVASTNLFSTFPKWFAPIAKVGVRVLFQSAKEGALPVDYLISSDVTNGDYAVPKLFKGIRGLPRKRKINKKYIHPEQISEIYRILDEKKTS